MWASELRKIASEINNDETNKQVTSAVEYLENLSLISARKGDFGLKIQLTKLPFTKKILEKSFSVLKQKGYTCHIDNEVTAWYSNTDCDSEDFVIINW